MRSAVTVSLVPQAAGGPFVFWNGLADACEQASALGFDTIEIFPPNADALDIPAIREKLKVALSRLGGTKVVKEETNYLHAVASTAFFRFRDDLELLIDPANGVVHIRSASRIGVSDLGANRKRVERLRTLLEH